MRRSKTIILAILSTVAFTQLSLAQSSDQDPTANCLKQWRECIEKAIAGDISRLKSCHSEANADYGAELTACSQISSVRKLQECVNAATTKYEERKKKCDNDHSLPPIGGDAQYHSDIAKCDRELDECLRE